MSVFGLVVPGANRSRVIPTVCRLLVVVILSAVASQAQSPATTCPPQTAVNVVHDTYGTVDVADPYRWLEDQNSPETRAWIGAQEKCTEVALAGLPGRASISKRLTELLRTDTLG